MGEWVPDLLSPESGMAPIDRVSNYGPANSTPYPNQDGVDLSADIEKNMLLAWQRNPS
jgi:hypothetical protein